MSKRKYLIAVFLVCALAGVYFLAFRTRYYLKESLNPYVHTLWNEHEAFIFVGKEKVGMEGTLLTFLYHGFMGVFAIQESKNRNDFIVVHLVDGQRYDSPFDNVKDSGTPFPFGGKIYYAGYLGEKQSVWCWDGKSFQIMGHEEGRSVVGKFQYFSDVIRKEGWKEANIPRSAVANMLEMIIDSRLLKLVIERQETNGRVIGKVTLQGRTDANSNETLAEIIDKWRTVSKSEYIRTFE